MRLELITTAGTIDTSGMVDPIQFEYSINDIRTLTDRKSTFSYDFRIPGTPQNNNLFDNIWQISAESRFNPNKKLPAYILCDSSSIVEGYLQLSDIFVNNKKEVEYNVNIFGENDSLIRRLGSSLLTDYDFSDMDHTWTFSSITNSWSSDTGYYYGLVNYFDWEYNDINGINNSSVSNSGVTVSQMRPAYNAKRILDRIFNTIGMGYESQFLESDEFKRLWLLYNGNDVFNQPTSFATDRSFRASISNNSAFTSTVLTTIQNERIYFIPNFNNDSTLSNFDNGGLYDNTIYTYSSDTYSIQTFTLNVDYTIDYDGVHGTSGRNMAAELWRVGDVNFLQRIIVNVSSESYNNRKQRVFTFNPINVLPGERYYIKFDYFSLWDIITPFGSPFFTLYSDNTFWFNSINTTALPGQTLFTSNILPSNFKAIDFLNGLIQKFNLFLEPKKGHPNTIIIEPYESFYSGGTIRNWTKKVCEEKGITEKPLSELRSVNILFTDLADKDYLNDYYSQSVNKQIYGQQLVITDNDFLDPQSTETISTSFSPSPLINILGSTSIICPEIVKLGGNNTLQSTNFNLRLLQSNEFEDKRIDCTGGEYWALEGTQFTNYPYIGHLQHPFSGESGNDLNYGQTLISFYNYPLTSKNAYAQYWRKYIDEITDRDSKLVSCYVNLTYQDIADLRFADIIFIDELTPEGGFYFRLNKINYSPNSTEPAYVELLKLKVKASGNVPRGQVSPRNISNEVSESFALVPNFTFDRPSNLTLGISNSINGVRNLSSGLRNSITTSDSITLGNFNNNSARGSINIGNNNILQSTAEGSVVVGNNITATTSNALFVNKIISSNEFGSKTSGIITGYTSSSAQTYISLYEPDSSINTTTTIKAMVSAKYNSGGTAGSIGGTSEATFYNKSIVGNPTNIVNSSNSYSSFEVNSDGSTLGIYLTGSTVDTYWLINYEYLNL